MDRGEYHYEVSSFDVFATPTHSFMEFLERLASSGHVYYVDTNFNDQLLRLYNLKTKLFTKCVLAKFMVSVKAFSRYYLMHLNHLPQSL